MRTRLFENLEKVASSNLGDAQVLVDIPIGFQEGARRQCDSAARDLLGSRGNSVFFPPCRTAVECDDYETANEARYDQIGHGLSMQAYSIGDKILDVNEIVGWEYDGSIRESYPELCFAALNGQPIAYSKSSQRGQRFRMHLLSDELDIPRVQYKEACREHLRKDVRRNDILDSMVLAAAGRKELTAVPAEPASDVPRVYYPGFEIEAEIWEE
ncbi:DUF429 domain-containing protein [Haloarcula sp. S1CR25-12]|uniref:DUF429 domain-containing protein n=1 Tax=Haloarcula saliterrae TaxID=2950534 RepID=A0ABU2FJ95_9EURY|nr:DUF429 domain-containing protein [Haloarcula sp. S1CR25-12]